MHPFPCSFALLLLLLFTDAHSENLIEQAILPVDQPFLNNNNTVTSTPTIETEIIAAEKTYLMKLRVKTSGADIETYATLDTGSDLIWLNAKGCCGDACHCSSNENSKSKTTTTTTTNQQCIEKPGPENLITCGNQNCDALARLNIEKKCSWGGDCMYDITYRDGFISKGKLGKGKFGFGQKTDLNSHFVFGASTISCGPFQPNSQGIVGLGLGELSLPQQLITKIKTLQPKFSYCLPNPKSQEPKSKIKFGKSVATSEQFSTRLLTKQEGDSVCVDCDCEHRYCVHLSTISLSLNDRKDKITVSEANKVMVIDSGSTFTSLFNGLFGDFFEKVKNVIGDNHEPEPVKPADYDHCFKKESAKELKVSFEFEGVGGSETTKIELKQENFFDGYTSNEGNNYLCLTVKNGEEKKNNHRRLLHEEDFGRENENSNQPHILGNRAQMDFLVAFDLGENKKVSFDKKKCSDGENQELSVLSE